jgi:hypothetical protein
MTTLRKIEPEADNIVKDGQAIRVRMTMVDAAVQQELADKFSPKPFVADHHRPHYGFVTDEQKKAAHDRHAARDKKLSDAWKTPEPIYAGANFPQGGHGHVVPERAGVTMCTGHPDVGNAPGSAANVVGAAELDALQQANQRRYNARIEAAWKSPINAGAK